ncbi:hypothetical protein AEGHOMDF_3841 [Methylobacterium soli]|nr:hypothetical protein AEGHOMDF_3841 [Methylobacterium soli]
MSTVSSPALPLIVMVLKFRLVGSKLPIARTMSLPPAVLIVISSTLSSSAMTETVPPTIRVMTISVSALRPVMPAARAAARA